MTTAASGQRILLLGAAGQVGSALSRTLQPLGTVLALNRSALDLRSLAAVKRAVHEAKPTIIVNAAAHTAVDNGEQEIELAYLINRDVPTLLAEEARAAGALFVHYSTDYVFDGSLHRPYVETDAVGPLSVYGSSKLAGDQGVLAVGADAYILRVSWVYGMHGKNFLRTILRLAAECDEIRVVADQHGSPTWSHAIAEATTSVLSQLVAGRRSGVAPGEPGVYHLSAPDRTTWYGFASAIIDGTDVGDRSPVVRLVPIATAEFPTLAKRPANSAMSSEKLKAAFGVYLAPWREQLRRCIALAR